jgi:hypothetical protein
MERFRINNPGIVWTLMDVVVLIGTTRGDSEAQVGMVEIPTSRGVEIRNNSGPCRSGAVCSKGFQDHQIITITRDMHLFN